MPRAESQLGLIPWPSPFPLAAERAICLILSPPWVASPPDDISCCAPSIGGQRAPWGVIKTPEKKKSSLTPATKSIVLIKGELWLSADKSRRRGGVREEDSEGRRKLAGVLGVRGNSLVMLTGSAKSRHSPGFVRALHLHETPTFCSFYRWLRSISQFLKRPVWCTGVEDPRACVWAALVHGKLARNPGENTLQLLVRPDSVFLCAFRGVSSGWFS